MSSIRNERTRWMKTENCISWWWRSRSTPVEQVDKNSRFRTHTSLTKQVEFVVSMEKHDTQWLVKVELGGRRTTKKNEHWSERPFQERNVLYMSTKFAVQTERHPQYQTRCDTCKHERRHVTRVQKENLNVSREMYNGIWSLQNWREKKKKRTEV